MHLGETKESGGGFWIRNAQGEKVTLNATRSRGRIYQALSQFPDPEIVTGMCHELLRLARDVVPQLPPMTPTHLLLLYYTTHRGIPWHRDNDPNDGDNLEPIVSISVGNSCVFGYKKYGRPEQHVRLHSGDVVIWGGPERNLSHCVKNVEPGTGPARVKKLMGDARLNFTFRSAPNILGFEHHYGSQQYFMDVA
jgi:alkylated DNA repair protein (DNA oxidative demethylase)